MSKSEKLAKSTFNKWVLLRISVRIRCPIPNCPKSHIRHKNKIKNLPIAYCLLPIAYCLLPTDWPIGLLPVLCCAAPVLCCGWM